MKMITADEMKHLEKTADQEGLPFKIMMENAGKGLANVVSKWIYGDKSSTVVVGWVGTGNNGGDALIALEYLSKIGWRTVAFCYRRNIENEYLCIRLKEAGGEVLPADLKAATEYLHTSKFDEFCILDGFLGTGFHPPISSDLADFIKGFEHLISNENSTIIAVDCPSGIDCISGEVDPTTINADLTVCMAAIKSGLLTFPAFEFVGELKTVDIGLSTVLPGWEADLDDVADNVTVSRIIPKRSKSSHKGTFGKVLILGSSINYCGAVLLAGKAAYRSGSGLVTIGVTEPVYSVVAGQLIDATWLVLPGDFGNITDDAVSIIHKEAKGYDAVLLGPGLGLNSKTEKFIETYLTSFKKVMVQRMGFVTGDEGIQEFDKVDQPPMVIDADALKCLAKMKNWWKTLNDKIVLTPHPGEMRILTGLTVEDIQADRKGVAERFAKLWNKVIVLKGALTVIAAPDGRTCVIPVASSALAHAGTGDVLAGVITSLMAQGVAPYEAAIAGSFIHAKAGLTAAWRMECDASVMASDVTECIGEVIGELEKQK